MLKKIISVYKIPLLLSLTLFVVLIALNVTREPLLIAATLIGCLIGMFVLDADYFLQAYILEPEQDFSKTFRGFVEHKDFGSLVNHIYYHKNEVKERTLNSALFQIIFSALTVLVLSSSGNTLIKATAMSVFVNTLYRMIEMYFEGTINDWFWSLKLPKTRNTFYLYSVIMLAVFVFCLTLY